MKTLCPVVALLLTTVTGRFAQDPAFTDQGRLTANGVAASGRYEMRFSPWNAATGGAPVSGVLGPCHVPVAGGMVESHDAAQGSSFLTPLRG